MSKFLHSVLLLNWFWLVSAQNLVPNPSFEDTLGCPSLADQLYLSSGWSSYSNTPDFFHTCAPPGGVSTPSNGIGYQVPQNGFAYAGFIAFHKTQPNAREFIGIQLMQPLILGVEYQVSFYVSLADFASADCWCDKIGAKFSTVPFNAGAPAPITNTAHIYTDSLVWDESTWTHISGSFVADSAFEYLIIGNFFDDGNTDTLNCLVYGYYYLDEICVSSSTKSCSIGTNVDDLSVAPFSIHPNPANEFFSLKNEARELSYIEVFNSIGYRMAGESMVGKISLGFNCSEWNTGAYFLIIKDSFGRQFHEKLMIVH